MKHNEISDWNGKFISHINLGQTFNAMGESDKAAVNY